MTPEEISSEYGVSLDEARNVYRLWRESGIPLDEFLRSNTEVLSLGTILSYRSSPIAASTGDETRVDEARLPPVLPPEQLLVGKYQVLAKLGEGGQGTVYKVANPVLGRIEALKILREEMGDREDVRGRFAREARVLAQLRHPNIVPVHEVGEHDGRPWYTMDFVDGESAADLIARMGPLPTRAALLVARDAARALAAAHEKGIVHRDVKPHNIMVAPDASARDRAKGEGTTLAFSSGAVARFQVLLTDFGLARVAGEQSITALSGGILGTLLYMSPEQAGGEHRRVSAASDVYSLGATLYQMVTGSLPFVPEEGNPVRFLAKILRDEPRPPRSLVPSLSRDVETILLKCMEKEPARRYPGATELAEDIDRCLRGEAILARPRSAAYRLWRAAARRSAIVVPAAVLLAAAGAWGGYEWTRPGTLRLALSPPGAAVEIDGRPLESGPQGGAFDLPAGVHVLRVRAPDHETEERVLFVERRSTQEVRVSLERHTGFLEVEAEPPGSIVEIAGVGHGTPLRGLPLPTGAHDAVVQAPGRYRRRFRAEIKRGETSREVFLLPPAQLWFRPAPDWQGEEPAGDLDGDGVGDFRAVPYSAMLVAAFSGRTGETIFENQISGVNPVVHRWVDLDGDGIEEMFLLVPAERDGKPRLAAYSARAKGAPLWIRDDGASPRTFAVLDGAEDALPEIAVLRDGGAVELLSGRDGKTLWSASVGFGTMLVELPDSDDDRRPDLLVMEGASLAALSSASGGILWSAPGERTGLALLLSSGGEVATIEGRKWTWRDTRSGLSSRESTADRALSPSFLAPRLPFIVELSPRGEPIGGWDASKGRLLWEREPDSPPFTEARWNGGKDPGHCYVGEFGEGGALGIATVAADRSTLDMRSASTGELLWSRHEDEPLYRELRAGNLAGDGRREIGYLAGARAVFLDAATGEVERNLTLPARGTLIAGPIDVFGDGARELVCGTAEGHLVAFDLAGRELFGLRTEGPVLGIHFVHLDRDGVLDFAVTTGGTAAARGPKILWEREMANAVRPGAVLADANADGAPDVVVPVYWPGRDSGMAALDGRTGREIWFERYNPDMIRRAATLDVTGDGVPEIASWRTSERSLLLLDAATGHPVADAALPGHGYAEPAVGDLDRDGEPELVLATWKGDVIAIRGRESLDTIWKSSVPGSIWGRPALLDADGDGRPEVFVASHVGLVASLDPASGEARWAVEVSADVRAPISVARPSPGAPAVALVSTATGILLAMDAASGEKLWAKEVAADGYSGSLWIDLDRDGDLEIVVGTARGLLALDAGGNPLWLAESAAVLSPPAAFDLEGDGALEILAGDAAGTLVAVEAKDGRLRWAVETGGAIESSPAAADMDGDGWLDLVVTSHSRKILCVSGKGRLPH